MITEQEKRKILETILASEEFSHSTKNQELLSFLVEASLQGKEMNEMAIAIDFLGKDSNFNPLEDASIRVNISQLRKRLANYYLTQGKNEKLQISIPKGHYDVRFIKKSEVYHITSKQRLLKWLFPTLTTLLSIVLIFLWIDYKRLNKKIEIIPEDNPVWAEYFEESKPTLVILGDYFFMYLDRQGPNPRFNVRDPRINSLEDFNEYNKKGPEGIENLKPLRHTYLRPSAVWGFMEVLPLLKSSKSSFLVKQASETDWEDISSHNVIFIGTFKQMYLLKPLLKNINSGFSLYPDHLYINNEQGELVQKFSSTLNDETRQYNDVSFITKFKGPNKNTILFIMGFQEGGVIYGSKAITNPNFLDELLIDDDNKLKSPLNFRLILRVQGFLRSDLTSKIEFFETLSGDD